jgi:hypothetical protein
MMIDINGLISSGAGLAGVALGDWMGRRTRAREAAQRELDDLAKNFDTMATAVTRLRSEFAADRLLRTGWLPIAQTLFLGTLTALGAAAASTGESRRRTAAGLGALASYAVHERRESIRVIDKYQPLMAAIATAALPLIRHPDSRVVEATNRLVKATSDIKNAAELDTATEEFGAAVRAVLNAPQRRRFALRGRL